MKNKSWGERFLAWCPPGYRPQFLTNPPWCSPNTGLRHLKRRASSPFLMLLAVVSLTATIGHRFYNEPRLAVGTQAPETIVAPRSADIINLQATAVQKQLARSTSGAVYTLDPQANHQAMQLLTEAFNEADAARAQAGPLPYVDVGILATAVQINLRQLPPAQWRAFQAAFTPSSPLVLPPPVQPAVEELKAYQIQVSPSQFQATLAAITKAHSNYQAARTSLPASLAPGFLDLSVQEWNSTQARLTQITREMLAQGIFPRLVEGLTAQAIAVRLQDANLPPAARPWAQGVLLQVLQPNLIEDVNQTQARAQAQADAVTPVRIVVVKGEVIVHRSQVITPTTFTILDHFNLTQRGVNWLGLGGLGLLVSLGMGIFWLVQRRERRQLRRRDQVLILGLCLSAPLLPVFGVATTSLPLVGMLMGSFFSPALAVTVILLMAMAMPVGLNLTLNTLLATAAGGVVGGLLAGRMRSREEITLLGVAIGVVQGLVYLLLGGSGGPWYLVLGTGGLYGVLGFGWSIVALGVSPSLEHLFDLITPIRLAELANPNRPLLKRLATEAPGTFQHTMLVATLAEAAARTLGCNVELVRTGTLYHDIGKMHDPQGFIENQMGGVNKHDLIADPWESAQIIKKHVTEGLVMARQYRLPRAIQAFIPEHQGSMAIVYFYHQALQKAKENPQLQVHKADFCYDGPIPQSRETGLVMLADSCEAALRSLKDATPEMALAMLQKILKTRWQDGQLQDSGLLWEEMPQIADTFVRVWQQFHHQRIAYPKHPVVQERA